MYLQHAMSPWTVLDCSQPCIFYSEHLFSDQSHQLLE